MSDNEKNGSKSENKDDQVKTTEIVQISNLSEKLLIKKPEDPQISNGKTDVKETPELTRLRWYLNRWLRIKITDGRTLIGLFLCTDRDLNIILGRAVEHVDGDGDEFHHEPRMIGLIMIPGRHIVSIEVEVNPSPHPAVIDNSDYLCDYNDTTL